MTLYNCSFAHAEEAALEEPLSPVAGIHLFCSSLVESPGFCGSAVCTPGELARGHSGASGGLECEGGKKKKKQPPIFFV